MLKRKRTAEEAEEEQERVEESAPSHAYSRSSSSSPSSASSSSISSAKIHRKLFVEDLLSLPLLPSGLFLGRPGGCGRQSRTRCSWFGAGLTS